VKYWEIGNEPRVGVVVPYGVVNGYTFIAPPSPETDVRKNDYRERYAALTTAMRAEDPTIKVGPALVSGQSTTERPLLDSLLNAQPDGSRLPIDFISYHPYERMGDLNTAAEIETHLGGIYTKQAGFRTYLRGAITASGRDPNAIELVASEHNVSYHTTGDTVKEAQMAHALGTAETIFSHARLGLKASHYWIHAVDQYDGTEYPVFKAMEGLRDHMGDTLLATSASGNARTYTTRDSATGELAVWVLNFDNDDDITIDLALQGLSGDEEVTLMRLGALSGDTTLFSSNLASHQTGGPTLDVDWRSFDVSGIDLSAYALSAPAATLSVLLIQPVPEPAAATGLIVVAAGLLRRSRAARRSNGDITGRINGVWSECHSVNP
jgi:alpha-L-arabinofuranosidase